MTGAGNGGLRITAALRKSLVTEIAAPESARAVASMIGAVIKEVMSVSPAMGTVERRRRKVGFVSRHCNLTLSTLRLRL